MFRQAVGLIIALACAACVTSVDFTPLAGNWQGQATSARGTFPTAWDVKPDGSVSWSSGSESGTGMLAPINQNSFRWVSSSGRTGLVTVHESPDGLLLRYDGDGPTKAELIRKK